MTSMQIYESVLVELNKVNVPSLLLEDFNYLFNRAINLYINKKYNVYDVNLQSTDDMRVLKATTILTPHLASEYYDGADSLNGDVTLMQSLYGATYEVDLPDDYLHILNCICVFKVNKNFKCYNKNTYVQFGAERLTADIWGLIINNFYMRPSYKRPYYYIHNVNTVNDGSMPTNPIVGDDYHITSGTDFVPGETEAVVTYNFSSSTTITLGQSANSTQSFTVISTKTTNGTPENIDWTIDKDSLINYNISISGNTITFTAKAENDSTSNQNLETITLTLTESGKLAVLTIKLKVKTVNYYLYYGESKELPNSLPTPVLISTTSGVVKSDIEILDPTNLYFYVGVSNNLSDKTIKLLDSDSETLNIVETKDINGITLHYLYAPLGIGTYNDPFSIKLS